MEKYICPMCRKNKHNLCGPSFCDCKHQRKLKNPGKPSESVHTVSGGLPTLGKGHK
jgi:hypothetical protein